MYSLCIFFIKTICTVSMYEHSSPLLVAFQYIIAVTVIDVDVCACVRACVCAFVRVRVYEGEVLYCLHVVFQWMEGYAVKYSCILT